MDNTPKTEITPIIDLCGIFNRAGESQLIIESQLQEVSEKPEEICHGTDVCRDAFDEKTEVNDKLVYSADHNKIQAKEDENPTKNFFLNDELFERVTQIISDPDGNTDGKPIRTRKSHYVFVYLLNSNFKRILKLMSEAISKTTCRIQRLAYTIYQSILILFGMCSTRPRYIYAAIFGSSSTRILFKYIC